MRVYEGGEYYKNIDLISDKGMFPLKQTNYIGNEGSVMVMEIMKTYSDSHVCIVY